MSALTGISHAQAVAGSAGVDMGDTGNIYNAPYINYPSLYPGSLDWSSPSLQGFIVPAAQLTGIDTSGNDISYLDLLPLQSQSMTVVDSTGPVIAMTAGASAGDPGVIQIYDPVSDSMISVLSVDSSGNPTVGGSPVVTSANASTLGVSQWTDAGTYIHPKDNDATTGFAVDKTSGFARIGSGGSITDHALSVARSSDDQNAKYAIYAANISSASSNQNTTNVGVYARQRVSIASGTSNSGSGISVLGLAEMGGAGTMNVLNAIYGGVGARSAAETGTVSLVRGVYANPGVATGHNVKFSSIIGVQSTPSNYGSQTTSTMYGGSFAVQSSGTLSGAVTTATGLTVSVGNSNFPNQISTGYAINVGPVVAQDSYGIYQTSYNNQNYLNSRVGIGGVAPAISQAYVYNSGSESSVGVASGSSAQWGVYTLVNPNVSLLAAASAGARNTGGAFTANYLNETGSLSTQVGSASYAGTLYTANAATVNEVTALSGIVYSQQGTIGTAYGLYLGASSAVTVGGVTYSGTITNNFGVYQSVSAQTNYLAGNIGLGVIAPTTRLDLNGRMTIRQSSAPTANPPTGWTMWVDSSGVLKATSANGTVATLATPNP
ncbi:hypothetical protein [Haloferula luteola]|nr:hypothetical protein [Haloferula luteola]